jgi:pimeloyl-ACP methyl ester carboxylesterase
MTATLTSDYVQAAGERIHYVKGGHRADASALPIVLVHGLAGDITWWGRNLEALCGLTEVFALDLPGFGRSWTPGPFSIETEYEALADWLSGLDDVQRAIVVGHSLGGYLAALLAARLARR